MAEGWSSNVLCRYYLSGCCREGASCRYSHDRNHAQPSNICRYYQKGQCAYGSACRYDHVKPTSCNVSPNKESPSQHSVGNDSHIHSSASGTYNVCNTTQRKAPLPCLGKLSSHSAERATDGKMTVLKREHQRVQPANNGNDTGCEAPSSFVTSTTSVQNGLAEWAEAPEFVPTTSASKSYATVLDPSCRTPEATDTKAETEATLKNEDILCPYYILGECRFGDQCLCIHGDVCELCSQACLHPTDEKQRRLHREECMKAHEQDMELSFAIARSKDKMCSICMDIIIEKHPVQERRFGILPNCTHVFCLNCIRTWRSTKQLENKTIRSCPQCRTPSDFVAPSKYWVEAKEDKDKLIDDYKKALSIKPCKYFKQGSGECPFAGNCFYLHAYPDGRKADLPPPRPRRRRNGYGEFEIMEQVLLWDFLDQRDGHWLLHLEWEDMFEFISDSDESLDDFSDFDF